MKENASRMTAVIAALRKAGVAEKDMQTSSVNLQPQYRYQENQPPQLVGYQASNMVQVRFRKIEDSGRIIDALVAQGANQINGPSLSRSEEHTSELQSLMRISYAVFCLKK